MVIDAVFLGASDTMRLSGRAREGDVSDMLGVEKQRIRRIGKTFVSQLDTEGIS